MRDANFLMRLNSILKTACANRNTGKSQAATERAGGDACYIKFGAARSELSFEALLDSCETLAASKNLKRVIAGANAGREMAWKRLIARGFRADFQGVAMQRHNDPGYNRPDTYIIDDWR
jgi:hypothetical protein